PERGAAAAPGQCLVQPLRDEDGALAARQRIIGRERRRRGAGRDAEVVELQDVRAERRRDVGERPALVLDDPDGAAGENRADSQQSEKEGSTRGTDPHTRPPEVWEEHMSVRGWGCSGDLPPPGNPPGQQKEEDAKPRQDKHLGPQAPERFVPPEDLRESV